MSRPHDTPPASLLQTPDQCLIGYTPDEVWHLHSRDELQSLPERLQQWRLRHTGGEISGLLSYDAGLLMQDIAPARALNTPLAVIQLYSPAQVSRVNNRPAYPAGDYALLSPFVAETTDQQYFDAVKRIHHYEQQGDCYQINFARRFQARVQGDPFAAFQQLADTHPAPWTSYMSVAEGAVFGVSPECFLRIHDGTLTTQPIKGSRPRAAQPERDRAIAQELLHSEKDRAENLMIVDLLRNDLGRVSVPGSVKTPALFELHQFSNVQHLISTVTSQLADGVSAIDALLNCFPGGSITGAPKKRAMEIIDELEPFSRGYYCGSQFWLDADGNLDANILIRSFQWSGDHLYCHGGGGIVFDSDAATELAESDFKVRALMDALATARSDNQAR